VQRRQRAEVGIEGAADAIPATDDDNDDDDDDGGVDHDDEDDDG